MIHTSYRSESSKIMLGRVDSDESQADNLSEWDLYGSLVTIKK